MGVFGLFLLSALDSSFLVLPFGNDLLLIALVSSNRGSLVWLVYVVVSAIGSVVGVLIVDLLMRKMGEKGLERFVSQKRVEKLKQKLENKAGITVFIARVINDFNPEMHALGTGRDRQHENVMIRCGVALPLDEHAVASYSIFLVAENIPKD